MAAVGNASDVRITKAEAEALWDGLRKDLESTQAALSELQESGSWNELTPEDQEFVRALMD